ncbi:MAG: SEC-C domain-containing protein [Rhizobiales bacterium]|nr:SEC-C domain-containing protein [Hyphomicrobiales bacterium]
MICPCGSKLDYTACCGPFHAQTALPETAEALMRSRYAAFATGRIDYLKATTWPKFQRDFDDAGYSARSKNSTWLGLAILATEAGLRNDTTGTVTFVATSLHAGALHRQREKSEFRKKQGRWYYVAACDETSTASS